MSRRNIEYLINLAYKTSLTGRHSAAKVGAVLINGGRIIDKESNMSRPFGDHNRGFHAEERLIKRCGSYTKNSTLVVVRSNCKGKKSTMSRPCSKCFPLVVKSGIKKIIYVDWNGETVVEKVKF